MEKNNFGDYGEAKYGQGPNFEEQLREALPYYLKKTGYVDEKGEIIPDGQEILRINYFLGLLTEKDKEESDYVIREDDAEISALTDRDNPLTWCDTPQRQNALRIYGRILYNSVKVRYNPYVEREAAKQNEKLRQAMYALYEEQGNAEAPSLENFYGSKCLPDIVAEQTNMGRVNLCETAEKLEANLRPVDKLRFWLICSQTGAVGKSINSSQYFEKHDKEYLMRLCISSQFPENTRRPEETNIICRRNYYPNIEKDTKGRRRRT